MLLAQSPHHWDEEHEEVKPAFIRKSDPEYLRPEAIRCEHRVGLLCLSGIEGAEGVTPIAVLEKGILDGRTVDRAR